MAAELEPFDGDLDIRGHARFGQWRDTRQNLARLGGFYARCRLLAGGACVGADLGVGGEGGAHQGGQRRKTAASPVQVPALRSTLESRHGHP